MAMKKVKSGKVAFIWESALLDYSAMKSGCKLTTVRLGFGHSTYAFVLKSGSPYTAEISKHIKVLEENGFLKELNKKYFPKNCTDGSETDENTHSFDAIRWTSLVGVADLLLYAAAFSIIVLVMEWVVASLSDIDKTNPKAPATFKRAILARWRRMLTDAKQNWLPFQTTRQHWARNASKKGASVLQRNKVEPDQWKRYTSSSDAINLKPGQSISNPQISDP